MEKIIIYVGCALTHASEEFKKDIERLKTELSNIENTEILEFLGLIKGTATDVYEHDIHECVKKADLIIAECSYPSTGLGWELATAVEKLRKSVLAVAKTEVKVTRLVLGAECARNLNYSFKTYNSFEELFNLCVEKIKEVKKYINASAIKI